MMGCRRHATLTLLWLSVFVSHGLCLNNGMALKPAMGFNTWSAFALNVNETAVEETARLLVSLGLKDAGYEFLVVDDGWSELERLENGTLVANSQKFPSGMARLASSLHRLGLKFGMYADAGAKTCGGYPGSRGYEEKDAASFAAWGADYLKYDNCYAEPTDPPVNRYRAMRDALNTTRRPILYSLCDWGVAEPWLWGESTGNSWRTTVDSAGNWNSVMSNLDNNVGLARFARRGAWNDPDMLQIGNGLTTAEQRSHFALWALLKSPLMISTDLAQLDSEALAILKAREIIAVHQDDLDVPGDLIWKQGSKEIYAGPISGGRRVVILFNRAHPDEKGGARITVRWSQLGYEPNLIADVRDLYYEQDVGKFRTHFSTVVPPHDVAVILVSPTSAPSRGRKESLRAVSSNFWDDGWRPWHGQAMFQFHDEDLQAFPTMA